MKRLLLPAIFGVGLLLSGTASLTPPVSADPIGCCFILVQREDCDAIVCSDLGCGDPTGCCYEMTLFEFEPVAYVGCVPGTISSPDCVEQLGSILPCDILICHTWVAVFQPGSVNGPGSLRIIRRPRVFSPLATRPVRQGRKSARVASAIPTESAARKCEAGLLKTLRSIDSGGSHVTQVVTHPYLGTQ